MIHVRTFRTSFLLLWLAWGIAFGRMAVDAAPMSASASDTRARQSEVVQHLHQQLPALRGETPDAPRMLRVVYFHPKDAEPLKDYASRIERIMFDVRDFYQEGMAAFGVEDWALPLEITGGKMEIHVVEGREKREEYNYDTGRQILNEIRSALNGTIQFNREHVIVFHGLCEKEPDGSYRFRAPYYGSAAIDNQSGICHVADCEMLDPLYYEDTERRIRYAEHYGTYDQTLADFNTKYIGGVAHELGHALGLPHVSEAGEEKQLFGTALMGAGNHTYRRERWDPGRRGTFLTMVSAVRLLSHPLYTQCGRADTRAENELAELTFRSTEQTLTVQGNINGEVPAYAVVMHVDPEGESDYDSDAGVSSVVSNTFNVSVTCWKPGAHDLKLDVYQADGTHRRWHFPFTCTDQAEPDTAGLTGDWLVRHSESAFLSGDISGAIEQAQVALGRKDISVAARSALEHVINLAKPAAQAQALPVDSDKMVYLSDIQWESARVGWGKPTRNQYWHDVKHRDALLLKCGGNYFVKGLYAHAPSSYVFKLDGKFSRFQATVGLQEGCAKSASGVFIVCADENELYRSQRLGPGKTDEVDLNIEGLTQIELVVESGQQGNGGCWTIWGSPRVLR